MGTWQESAALGKMRGRQMARGLRVSEDVGAHGLALASVPVRSGDLGREGMGDVAGVMRSRDLLSCASFNSLDGRINVMYLHSMYTPNPPSVTAYFIWLHWRFMDASDAHYLSAFTSNK